MGVEVIYIIIIVVLAMAILVGPGEKAKSAKPNVTDKGLPKPKFTPPPMPRVKPARIDTVILRFRAYSMRSNPTAGVLVEDGSRFRGCNKGDPMIVFGHTIEDSERNLDKIRMAFKTNPKAKILENKRGSFTVEVTI